MANNFTQQQEKEIENIVKNYVQKDVFKHPTAKTVPSHNHGGIDNIGIPRSSIINQTAAAFVEITPPNGTVIIKSGIVNPSQVSFDGIAYDGVTSIQLQNYVLGSPGSVGSQVATLASAWGGSTASSQIIFTAVDGSGTESRLVSFTNGSLTITWSPALTLNDSLTIQSVSATHKSIVTGFARLGKVVQLLNGLQSTKNTSIYQTNSSTFFDSSSGAWVPWVNCDVEYLAAIYSSGNSSFALIASIQITAFTNTSITINTTCASGYILKGSLSIS